MRRKRLAASAKRTFEVSEMAKELTTIALEKIKPGPTRREIPDGRIGDLYFIVQPSGKVSWALRYRALC
jgi:hypothetical protein